MRQLTILCLLRTSILFTFSVSPYINPTARAVAVFLIPQRDHLDWAMHPPGEHGRTR